MNVSLPQNLEADCGPNQPLIARCRRTTVVRRCRRFLAWGVVAAMPLVLGAGDSFEERRTRIEGMTAVERAALEHNFKIYQSLSGAEKKKYADLDREVHEDKQGLDRILENYADWLKTLPFEKREELRTAPDATTRMQVVRRLREEQDRQKSSAPVTAGPLAQMLHRGNGPWGKNLQAEFTAMMAIVERRAGVPPERRKELESLPAPQRHLRVLVMSLRNAEEREGGRFPDETLVREIVSTLPDEQARRRFRDLARPEQQRQMVAMTLLRGLSAEWQEEIEKRKPSEAELQKFFGSIDEKKRAELVQQPRDFAEKQILWMYQEQQSDEFANDLKEFRRLMQKVVPKEGMRPPNEHRNPSGHRGEGDGPDDRPPPPPRNNEFNGPPGERPPGERPQGERFPGDRPPPGERRPRPEGPRPEGPRPDGPPNGRADRPPPEKAQ